jgi:RNA polymerase sigma-70 factor (ECF subfamily)
MAARLTRAKRKIALAGIPMRIPPRDELPARLDAVLAVVYQLFTAGHTAPSGTTLQRGDLTDEATRLGRVLHDLLPGENRVLALLAMMLAIDARRASRVDIDGRAVDLARQDRSLWNQDMIDSARRLLDDLPQFARRDPYALQAEIAMVHATARSFDETDWTAVVRLYDELLGIDMSPVTALNRAVAVALAGEPQRALDSVENLETGGHLTSYRYLTVVKADLLWRVGRFDESRTVLTRAIDESPNDAEREHLQRLAAERAAP